MNEKIIKLKENKMFATYKTPEELQNYFSNFSGSEHFCVTLGAMLMQNHIAYNFNLIEKKGGKNGNSKATGCEKIVST